MFNRKNLIILVIVSIFLSAVSIMAANSAKFVLTENLFVAGTEIEKGKYNVRWETTDEATKVTFDRVGKAIEITVEGKIQEVSKKYDYNNMAIAKDAEGRRAIRQLQFAGKNLRIVF